MRNVTDDYSPEVSRQKLRARFAPHPAIFNSIDKMTNTSVCALAALVDGKTLTTTGYETINADYGVKRASAVAQNLQKQFYIPVSRRMVQTDSDVGGKTKQAMFFITDEDQARLDNEPEAILKERQQEMSLRSDNQAHKDLKRLVREYTEEGVLTLLQKITSGGLSPDKKAN